MFVGQTDVYIRHRGTDRGVQDLGLESTRKKKHFAVLVFVCYSS